MEHQFDEHVFEGSLGRRRGIEMSAMTAGAIGRVGTTAPVAEAPLRLTRRGRVVLGVLVALVLAPVGTWFASVADADPADGARSVVVRTVGAGESLWSVAASVTAPGADVRDALQEIADLNGLTGSTIAAGQQLVVPVAD